MDGFTGIQTLSPVTIILNRERLKEQLDPLSLHSPRNKVTQLALGAFRAKLDRPATDYEAAPELFEFLEALFVELLAQIDLLLGPGRMLATCVSSLLLSTLHSRLHLTADQLAQKVVGIVGADGAGVTMGQQPAAHI
ncbi:hypothetical protein PLESTF_001590400 [Pleodorina starrii]|nr:hypothetical protein PLESTF_001590400 [Pleodorina starrii]